MSHNRVVRIESNKTFAWPKGLSIIASEPLTILLPSALVLPGEQIGSVIDVPDDADIGFRESENAGEAFSHIIIKLQKGQRAGISRSTQAVVLTESIRTITLVVED